MKLQMNLAFPEVVQCGLRIMRVNPTWAGLFWKSQGWGKWRLNQVRDETKRKEYEEKNLVGEIIKILVCN